jgi:hypothetical protein
MVTIHRTPSRNDRAIELLKRAAAEQDEISRINLIAEFVPHGRVNEPERRQWLEAWQVLERVGFVCPTLGKSKGRRPVVRYVSRACCSERRH